MKLILTLVIFISLSLVNCSGGHIPAVVCDYGQTVCSVSQTICRDIPGIPPEVCNYLDLACYNLDQLCRYNPESVEYKSAVISLENITNKLNTWSRSYKK